MGDVVVKTGNRDAEILVVQPGKQLTEDGERVGNGSAKNAGVQILRRAGNLHLVIVQAAQAIRNRRDSGREHRRVGNDQRVGLQTAPVFLNKVPQAHAADFLFPFDHDLDVDGQLALNIAERLQSFQVNVHLALVVGGAAPKEIAVAHGGLERGRGPQFERLGRLNVVVSVKKDGGFAGRFERLAIDQRVHSRGHNLDGLHSCAAELVGYPLGGALDVRLVLALGADAGDAQEFAELRKMRIALLFDVLAQVHPAAPP